MAGTYIYFRSHIIFSTKNRQSFIKHDMKDRLIEYIGGIIREQRNFKEEFVVFLEKHNIEYNRQFI